MTKINPNQKEGKKAVDSLLKITTPKKQVKKKPSIIEELEEMGIFG